MTLLALRFSRYANAVAMQHAKVSREMFPEFPIDFITNAFMRPTWFPIRCRSCWTPMFRRGGATICISATSSICRKTRCSQRMLKQEALLSEVATRTGPHVERRCAHDWFCAAGGHLQARHPAVHRSRAAMEIANKAGDCRSFMQARLIRRTSQARRSSTRWLRTLPGSRATCFRLCISRTTTGLSAQ